MLAAVPVPVSAEQRPPPPRTAAVDGRPVTVRAVVGAAAAAAIATVRSHRGGHPHGVLWGGKGCAIKGGTGNKVKGYCLDALYRCAAAAVWGPREGGSSTSAYGRHALRHGAKRGARKQLLASSPLVEALSFPSVTILRPRQALCSTCGGPLFVSAGVFAAVAAAGAAASPHARPPQAGGRGGAGVGGLCGCRRRCVRGRDGDGRVASEDARQRNGWRRRWRRRRAGPHGAAAARPLTRSARRGRGGGVVPQRLYLEAPGRA